MSVSVLGAGAFGTALAISLAGRGHVTLWARSADHAQAMQTARQNAQRLPEIRLPDAVHITPDLTYAARADILLLAVPMQQLRAFLAEYQALIGQKALVACCKGIDLETLNGPTGVIAQLVPDSLPAVLTGPSFAADIARGLPTALTLACADREGSEVLQKALTTDNLRLYRTTDTVGAELGGALKNVVALACGAVAGAGLGESARAALMTRGFAEIMRLGTALGADPYTLTGLSGFGDLVLTCTSSQSRNYRLGLSIGQGAGAATQDTVEGVATARAAHALAQARGIDLPITATVARLMGGEIDFPQAIQTLMSRPLKEE